MTAVAGLVYVLRPSHNITPLANTPAAEEGLVVLAAITPVSSPAVVGGGGHLADQLSSDDGSEWSEERQHVV